MFVDIAALSMGLSQVKVAQQANISVIKMAMETSESQVADLLKVLELNRETMEQTINPYLGGNIDISL